MANLIALLGKKDGGTRCIAVCTTFYRLFLAMLGEEVREWAAKVAMDGDTALHLAAEFDQPGVIEALLKHKADFHKVGQN